MRGYLGVLWVSGRLRGEKPSEAFEVKCDQTTMTEADITQGRVICQIGIASSKPSEFVFYRIHIPLRKFYKPLPVAV